MANNSIKSKTMNQCDDYYYFCLIQQMRNNKLIKIFPEEKLPTETELQFIYLVVTLIICVIRRRKRCE